MRKDHCQSDVQDHCQSEERWNCFNGNVGETFDTELRSCVKVEVAVLGSPSLIVLVDVKQH